MDQLARERHVQEKLIKPDISARIEKDKRCPGCGYNLKGLRYGGRCPECGAGIVQKRIASADAISELPLEYVKQMSRGMTAMFVGWVCLMLLGPMVLVRFAGPTAGVVMLVGALCFIWGCWTATKPRPGLEDEAFKWLSVEGATRILGPAACLPLAAVGVILAVPALWAKPAMLAVAGISAVTAYLILLAAQVCLCITFARMARDIDDQTLQESFTNLAWAFGIAGPLAGPVAAPGVVGTLPTFCASILLLPTVYMIAQFWFVFSVWRLARSMKWAVKYRRHVEGRDERLRERMARERLEERQAQAGE